MKNRFILTRYRSGVKEKNAMRKMIEKMLTMSDKTAVRIVTFFVTCNSLWTLTMVEEIDWLVAAMVAANGWLLHDAATFEEES